MEGRLKVNSFWLWFFKERMPNYTFSTYPDYLLPKSYLSIYIYDLHIYVCNFKISKMYSIYIILLLLVIALRGHSWHIHSERSPGFVVKFKFQF